MARVMIALGSPRKESSTRLLSEAMAEAAKEAGSEVEIVDAAHLEIGPCTACMACDRSDEFECVIDDAMKPLYAKLAKVDVLVLATPVYWFGPTAQMKAFIDRLYACIKFRTEEPRIGTCFPDGFKIAALITAGGDAFDGADLIVAMLKHAAQGLGFGYAGTLLATHCSGPIAVKADTALMERAREFGRSLAG